LLARRLRSQDEKEAKDQKDDDFFHDYV